MTPLKKCPTPEKHAYSSPGDALAKFVVAPYTRPHHPYLCCCGKYHMTSKPKGYHP
jgi:hypothetical protein